MTEDEKQVFESLKKELLSSLGGSEWGLSQMVVSKAVLNPNGSVSFRFKAADFNEDEENLN